jgi:hypothetical protein
MEDAGGSSSNREETEWAAPGKPGGRWRTRERSGANGKARRI